LEHNGIDDAEDRCVRADPERERHDDRNAERGVPTQHAVAYRTSCSASSTQPKLHMARVSSLRYVGLPSWVRAARRGCVAGVEVALEHRVVKPQLFVELGRQVVAPPAIPESVPDL
jgi:hypothetical protein